MHNFNKIQNQKRGLISQKPVRHAEGQRIMAKVKKSAGNGSRLRIRQGSDTWTVTLG